MSYLRRGVAGAPVKILQTKLGVPADGDFGPATEAALRAFQTSHGLAVDGVAGPDTFLKMGLGELVLLAPGVAGEAVKTLQGALGVAADGQFGPATEKALREFQQKNGLEVDGLAGPATLAKMPAFSAQIGQKQADAAVHSEPAAATQVATAALPSLDPKAPATKPPAKSIWATIKGWL